MVMVTAEAGGGEVAIGERGIGGSDDEIDEIEFVAGGLRTNDLIIQPGDQLGLHLGLGKRFSGIARVRCRVSLHVDHDMPLKGR